MNHRIDVVNVAPHTWEVRVAAARATEHRVRVSPDYAAKLVRPGETVESLIVRSFEFLLEREPNTSILGEFDLSVINRYFPDYETSIR